MAVYRTRFRIEERHGGAPMPDDSEDEAIPMHREIMKELRAIREQMGASRRGELVEDSGVTSIEAANAQALLETYRARIEQCGKLKVELNLIYDAINRTKHEIAVLHG